MNNEKEIKIQNGKFWILENRFEDKNIERYIYADRSAAIDRLKEIMKTVDTDKISLSSVDITSKGWNIESVPWSLIALGIIRGTISDTDEENFRKSLEQKKVDIKEEKKEEKKK